MRYAWFGLASFAVLAVMFLGLFKIEASYCSASGTRADTGFGSRYTLADGRVAYPAVKCGHHLAWR